MEKNCQLRIYDLWKQEVSVHLKTVTPFSRTENFHKIAAFFAPGTFYFYVFNFKDFAIDHVRGAIPEVYGKAPEEFVLDDLFKNIPSEDMEDIVLKEEYTYSFFLNYLNSEELPYYKSVYHLRLRDREGNIRKLLHQAAPLNVSGNGKIERLLVIHTDISYLNVFDSGSISFVNLKSGKSYYNLDPSGGKFIPPIHPQTDETFQDILSEREREIVKLISEGYKAKTIADMLNISFNTVRTHRKNILQKTGCRNSNELAVRCLVEGII